MRVRGDTDAAGHESSLGEQDCCDDEGVSAALCVTSHLQTITHTIWAL